jgi:hypothetical protein
MSVFDYLKQPEYANDHEQLIEYVSGVWFCFYDEHVTMYYDANRRYLNILIDGMPYSCNNFKGVDELQTKAGKFLMENVKLGKNIAEVLITFNLF